MKRPLRSSPRSAKPLRTVSIIGTGSYLPKKILTNADLSRMVHTSDDWITTRTGIKERRIAAKDENTSDMAARAAFKAIEQAKISSEEIELILVIGAEKLTSITNWTDRNTCVLFGDGAGAAILRHRGSAHGVISTHIGSHGRYTDILFMPGGGSRCPITRDNVDMNLATIHMTGKEVYKQAVTAMVNASKKVLADAGLTADDIACVIPHQANLRIIEAIANRLKIP